MFKTLKQENNVQTDRAEETDMSKLPKIKMTSWRSRISSTPRPPTLDAVFERNGGPLIGLACVSVKVASSLACHGLFNIFSFELSMWLWVTNKVLPHEIIPRPDSGSIPYCCRRDTLGTLIKIRSLKHYRVKSKYPLFEIN